MLTFVNNDGTRLVRCSDAVGYAMRSLRETAALGGFIRQRINVKTQAEHEEAINALMHISEVMATNFSNLLDEIGSSLKLDVLNSDTMVFAENLKTMLATLRSFPEIRGIGFNDTLKLGNSSFFEISFKNQTGKINYWFDAYSLVQPGENLAVGRELTRGIEIDVHSKQIKLLKAYISYDGMTTQNVRKMLENKDVFNNVCLAGSFLIHRISSGEPSVYEGLASAFTSEKLTPVAGFGAMSQSIRDKEIDSDFMNGVQSFAISEKEIYNEFDLRCTSSARISTRALELSANTYNEIMARGINAASGLTVLAEGYGTSVENSLHDKVILDIGLKRGKNLMTLKNRVKAFGFHKMLEQSNILELMKVLSSYSSELDKIPTISFSTLIGLADDGFRLQYLDSKNGDAILDSAGRLVLALNNSRTNAIPYYAKLPSEIEDQASARVILTNETADEEADGSEPDDDDALVPNSDRDKLMLKNALDAVNKEIEQLETKIGMVNANELNTNLISSQRALDDVITNVVELQGAQSVLNAQARSILVQVQKILSYPVISAVYGQNLGLVGDYTTITYDPGSRNFAVVIDKESIASLLARKAYCSTRVKYSCGVYDVYRGDTKTVNAWKKRETLEIIGDSVSAIREGYHGIHYMLDTETAKNMAISTSLKTYVLCTRKTKTKFWKKEVEVTPHTEVKRYSVTEDLFTSQIAEYLLRILNSEVMKAVAGIAEVIKAGFQAISIEANKVSELKSQLAAITNFQDLLGYAITQKRLIEFEMSIPDDVQPFSGVIRYQNDNTDISEVVNESDKALKISTKVAEKLDRLAFSSLNLASIESPARLQLEREKLTILTALQYYILSNEDMEGAENEALHYGDKSYGRLVESISCTLTKQSRDSDVIVNIDEHEFAIKPTYTTILSKISALFGLVTEGDDSVVFNESTPITLVQAFQQLIESMLFRFPDIKTTISDCFVKRIDLSEVEEKVNELKALDSKMEGISPQMITIANVRLSDKEELQTLQIDLDVDTEYLFTHDSPEVGYSFDFKLKIKNKRYYIAVEKRYYPEQNGEPQVPFGSVYYNPRSLVRFLYKMGLSNSTNKAVLAKIFDAFSVISSEQLESIITAMDLTEREMNIMASQNEANTGSVSEARSTTYILAGILFLLLDPSNLGLSRILQLEVEEIPNPSHDDEETSKKLGGFAKAVFASCCYDRDDLTV